MGLPEPRITKTPGVCGGDACICGTRVPVWIVEQRRRFGETAREMVSECWPWLTVECVEAALEYAAVNTKEIQDCIDENNTDSGD